jgi:hypothetical protein
MGKLASMHAWEHHGYGQNELDVGAGGRTGSLWVCAEECFVSLR